MNEPRIIRVDKLDFRLGDWRWPFSEVRRDEIAAHFRVEQKKRPALWNGRVFMLRNFEIDGSVLQGEFFETGFAEVLAWRDWDYADPSIKSCFAMAALESADKGFLVGVMGEHTANAGKIYFPTGTPDPDDLDGVTVDLEQSVKRELAEETGLDFAQLQSKPYWHTVFSGKHIALVKQLRSRENANSIRSRVHAFLAQQEQPELSDVRFVFSREDLTPAIPAYVQAFLELAWR